MIAAIDCGYKSLFMSAALTHALNSPLYIQAFTSLILISTYFNNVSNKAESIETKLCQLYQMWAQYISDWTQKFIREMTGNSFFSEWLQQPNMPTGLFAA